MNFFWGGAFFHTGYVIEEQKLNLNNVPDAFKALYFVNNYGKWYSSFGNMGKMVINKKVALGLDFTFPINTSVGPPLSVFAGMNFSFMY